MWQVLSGLAHIHQKGMFHRDVKPENLLVRQCSALPSPSSSSSSSSPSPSATQPSSADAVLTVKIADFGQCKDIRSRPPFTPYVSTRWYRAPELLSHSPSYSSPIDVWAAACIIAELHTLSPLFPGTTELDTLARISAVVESPTATARPSSSLRERLRGSAGEDALSLLQAMLQWDPRKRVSARQALRHDYFAVRVSRDVCDAGVQHQADASYHSLDDGSDDEDGSDVLTVNTPHGILRSRYFPPLPPPPPDAPLAAAEAAAPNSHRASVSLPLSLDSDSDSAPRSPPSLVSARRSSNPVSTSLPSTALTTDSDDEFDAFIREESARSQRGSRLPSARPSVGDTHSALRPQQVVASADVGADRAVGSRPSSVQSSRTRRMQFAGVGNAMFQ